MAVEQPVPARRRSGGALAQEGAERRDAGARADHDDRGLGRRGQAEAVGLLEVDLHLGGLGQALAEMGRGDAEPQARAMAVAHRIDGERDPARIGLGRGRDRVEPRLQLVEGLQKDLGVGARARELVQRPEHVEIGRVAVRILAGAERLGLPALRAGGQQREELEQPVGGAAQRVVGQQVIAQRLLAELRRDDPLGPGAELGDDRIGQGRGVGGKQAQRIADDVVDAGAGEVDLDVPGLLLAAGRVEAAAGEEHRLGRVLAAEAVGTDRDIGLRGIVGGRRGAGRGRGAELRLELLQHPERVLAARLAQVQALLGLEEEGVGIVGAVVAALAAILLGHGGHQLLRLRALLGQRHAVVEGHRRVVPGRVAVVGERRPAGRLARRQRRRALDRRPEQGGEVARQPGALVGGEGGGFGDQAERGSDVLGHRGLPKKRGVPPVMHRPSPLPAGGERAVSPFRGHGERRRSRSGGEGGVSGGAMFGTSPSPSPCGHAASPGRGRSPLPARGERRRVLYSAASSSLASARPFSASGPRRAV